MNFQLPDVSGLPASLQSASQSASDKLLQAATLSNVARVAIARLPEQILRISLPGTEKNAALDVRLPTSGIIKDGAPTFIANTTVAGKSTAVLMQSLEQRTQLPLTTKSEAALTQYLSRLIKAQPDTALTIQARVVATSANNITLTTASSQSQISLPVKQNTSALKPNDMVSVSIKPLPNGSVDISIVPKNAPLASTVSVANPPLTASATNTLIKAALEQTGITIKQSDSVPVPKQLDSHIPATPRALQTGSLLEKNLFLKLEHGAKDAPQLVVRQTSLHPVARTLISPDVNQLIRLPVQSNSALPAAVVAALPEAKLLPSVSQQPPGTAGVAPTAEQTAEKVAPVTGDSSRIKLSPEEQTRAHSQIIELSRLLLKDTGSTKEALGQLIQILKSGQINSGAQTKQTLAQLLTALQGADPKSPISEKAPTAEMVDTGTSGKPASTSLVQQIQSLISAPALAITPLQLTTPAPANNLVAGLVMLLQLTLAGRAINRQPALAAQADAPDQLLQKVVPQTAGGSSTPSRVSQDLALLESRSQFLSQVKTLLANHQQQKLSQADSRLQGQDSLYYVLPVTSQKGAPPEILVRADERGSRQAGSADSKRKLWNVTMKLDVGDFGELLAKSRIDGEVIELDLYTSTDVLLQRVADTLPLLKRRLTALGLEVAQSSVQRGKIPSTLNDRPYHIFETQA